MKPSEFEIERLQNLVAEKDKEIERLKSDIRSGMAAKNWTRIAELEAENSRLHDLVETYCPADERAGTPDQTRM